MHTANERNPLSLAKVDSLTRKQQLWLGSIIGLFFIPLCKENWECICLYYYNQGQDFLTSEQNKRRVMKKKECVHRHLIYYLNISNNASRQ